MDKIVMEDLLGKKLVFIEKVLEIKFKEQNYIQKYYSGRTYIDNDYFGMPYNFVSTMTGKNDSIQSITIHFRQVINRQFYNSFTQQYGAPNNIQIIENMEIGKKTLVKGRKGSFTQYVSKGTFNLREGTFEEKPLYIIWKKKDYQIRAFLRYEQDFCEITFSVLDNKKYNF